MNEHTSPENGVLTNGAAPGSAAALNPDDTEHYLETLIGPDWQTATLVFQTFDDNVDRKRSTDATAQKVKQKRADPYAKVLQGTWTQHRNLLTTLNKNGAGVFLTVNETVGGRKIEHLQRIRAVWVEWDTADPLPEWPLAPHLVVESSPEKYHVYWLTADMSPPDHHRMMQCLIGKWGSDPNAADAVRVLRMPGFLHQKVDARKGLTGIPWCVRLETAESHEALPLYPTAALFSAFGVEQWEATQQEARKEYIRDERQQGTKSRSFITPLNIVELKEVLKVISAQERQVWLKIGMALASTYHSAAFALWDEWSRTSPKYDEEDQYRIWQSFRENGTGSPHAEGITLGTLYKLAKDAGWKREEGWQQGLLTNQHGTPIACPANIALILRHTPLWKDSLRFDLFGGSVEYGEQRLDVYGRVESVHRWDDADDLQLADYLRAEHRMAVTNLSHCTQAVEAVAHDAAYDPIVTWLESLPPWDEVDRLSSFFEDYCQVERSTYAQFCGHTLFLSLVARAYAPGCQVDTALVLQGPEGARKTSLCRLIGGPWYRAITLSFESKDLFTSLRQTWLGELAELDSFARSGQARIKALLTTLSDSYRPPYARNEVVQPRRSVFVGTTNDPAYLVDPHGARRFLPITTPEINMSAIAEILPQLFAEARARYQRQETWWNDAPDFLAEAQEQREEVREIDPWEDPITRFVAQSFGSFRLEEISGSACLDIPMDRRTRATATRIGIILHRLGYVKKQQRLKEDKDKREYIYVKKETR